MRKPEARKLLVIQETHVGSEVAFTIVLLSYIDIRRTSVGAESSPAIRRPMVGENH